MGTDAECIAEVRSFSRFYTRILGLLDEGLLDTPFTLTEVRVLYEVGQHRGVEPVEGGGLRRSLGLDAGHLSRVLARLEQAGAITRDRSSQDRRRQVVRLTGTGRELLGMLNDRANQQVADILSHLDGAGQRRLVGALHVVESALGPAGNGNANGAGDDAGGGRRTVYLRPAGSGDHGWIVERHGVLYAREYRWDVTFEALVARVVADFVDQQHDAPAGAAAWIAEVDGERAGSVLCAARDETTAQLRLLLVEPWARGLGIGARLVDECVRFARQAGYERMMLWTNDVLADARRIYERAGFTLVESEPHHSFGQDLVGQVWELPLARARVR